MVSKNIKGINRIRGCLIGGAAGDALGFPIEFLSEKEIFDSFGADGITEYSLNPYTGTALISDDTQMTLFTAQGIIEAFDEIGDKRYDKTIRQHIAGCYQEWLYTQGMVFNRKKNRECSWLCGIPDLFDRRYPGNTCLSALEIRSNSALRDDYISDKINNSCGCGGVMRVAPIGFIPCNYIPVIDMEAAQAAAITHSHSLGFIPAALLAHIIHRSVYPVTGLNTLEEIVDESIYTVRELFKDDENIDKQIKMLKTAIALSENSNSDLDNIHVLGEGWVGDEALNIAVYCALKHKDDFSAGLIASVNHKGDSDSTGAIFGNILGAYLGIGAIEDKWKNKLELNRVIMMVADSFK